MSSQKAVIMSDSESEKKREIFQSQDKLMTKSKAMEGGHRVHETPRLIPNKRFDFKHAKSPNLRSGGLLSPKVGPNDSKQKIPGGIDLS